MHSAEPAVTMPKEIRIQPCYNQAAIIITKRMGLKEIYSQLKRLENQEVAGVYMDKPARSMPWGEVLTATR